MEDEYCGHPTMFNLSPHKDDDGTDENPPPPPPAPVVPSKSDSDDDYPRKVFTADSPSKDSSDDDYPPKIFTGHNDDEQNILTIYPTKKENDCPPNTFPVSPLNKDGEDLIRVSYGPPSKPVNYKDLIRVSYGPPSKPINDEDFIRVSYGSLLKKNDAEGRPPQVLPSTSLAASSLGNQFPPECSLVTDGEKEQLMELHRNIHFVSSFDNSRMTCCLCSRLTIIVYNTACDHVYCNFCRQVLSAVLYNKCAACDRKLDESDIYRRIDLETELLNYICHCVYSNDEGCVELMKLYELLRRLVTLNYFTTKGYECELEELNTDRIFVSIPWNVPGFPFTMQMFVNYRSGNIHLEFSSHPRAEQTILGGLLPHVQYTFFNPNKPKDAEISTQIFGEIIYSEYRRFSELTCDEYITPDGTPHFQVHVEPRVLRSMLADDILVIKLKLAYPPSSDKCTDERCSSPYCNLPHGHLLWKIEDYYEEQQLLKTGRVNYTASPHFYSAKRRYQLRAYLYAMDDGPYIILKKVGGPYKVEGPDPHGLFVQAFFKDQHNQSLFFTGIFYGSSCRIDMPMIDFQFMYKIVLNIKIEVMETDSLLKDYASFILLQRISLHDAIVIRKI